MSILLEKLEQKIPNWREDVRTLISDSGSSVISEVSLKQAYGGMRGVKGLVCDTSSVSDFGNFFIVRDKSNMFRNLGLKRKLPSESFSTIDVFFWSTILLNNTLFLRCSGSMMFFFRKGVISFSGYKIKLFMSAR